MCLNYVLPINHRQHQRWCHTTRQHSPGVSWLSFIHLLLSAWKPSLHNPKNWLKTFCIAEVKDSNLICTEWIQIGKLLVTLNPRFSTVDDQDPFDESPWFSAFDDQVPFDEKPRLAAFDDQGPFDENPRFAPLDDHSQFQFLDSQEGTKKMGLDLMTDSILLMTHSLVFLILVSSHCLV